jgi:TolA-binding protein
MPSRFLTRVFVIVWGIMPRRLIMSKVSSLIIALCVLLGAACLASGQQIHLPPAVSQSQGMGGVPVISGSDAQKQQAMAANQQRQLEIRRDTEKMAELTQELKDYLQKSDQSVMSLDAIKKAEQIEKLAHSVKSKMKQSY